MVVLLILFKAARRK